MDQHQDSHQAGLDLSRRYFAEAVQPIIATRFPTLRYAAALIGPGSEVLACDTARSRDHHWGPRLLIFLPDHELQRFAGPMRALLAEDLPHEFAGHPTSFTPPQPNGVRLLQKKAGGPVDHMVEVFSVRSYWKRRLDIDPDEPIPPTRWLTLPQQRLLELTRGEIFRDDIGELTRARRALEYFPDDVWLYLLASQWQRIAQEEAFLGRNDELEDELGAKLVAARLVRDLMKLGFLLDRHYWPYSKWFAPLFRRLPWARHLVPKLEDALRASSLLVREQAITNAYTAVAERHNELGITDPIDPAVRPFYDRPYLVIAAERFASATRARIGDPGLGGQPLFGSVDQFADCTDLVERPVAMARLQALYGS